MANRTKRKPPKNSWKPGQSGNPAGKAPGTKNRMTVLAQALLEADIEKIIGTVVAAALKGDLAAARLVIERVVPPAKERPLAVKLGSADLSTAEGVSAAASAVLQAACDGDLMPGEANTLSSIIEMRRKAIETEDISRRLAALEETKSGTQKSFGAH